MILPAGIFQGKVLVDTRGNGTQKVHLVLCQWLYGLDKQHIVDSQQVVEAAVDLFVGDDATLFGLRENNPSQLLHIGRIAVHQGSDAGSLLFADATMAVYTMLADIVSPVVNANFLQGNEISKLMEENEIVDLEGLRKIVKDYDSLCEDVVQLTCVLTLLGSFLKGKGLEDEAMKYLARMQQGNNNNNKGKA